METKICKGCELELNIDNFYTTKIRGRVSYRSKCKKCYNNYGDPDKKSEYHKNYSKVYRIVNRYTVRSETHSLAFSFEFVNFIACLTKCV